MKIYKALIEIEKRCPELFFLIRHCKIETENRPDMTAYASKTKTGFKLAINENWVENFDQYNLCAIIEHELLHVVLSHCNQLNTFKNKRLANIAMDAIINDIGNYFQDKTKLNAELSNGVFMDKLNKQYKTDFSSYNNTSLEIYNFLLEQKEDEKNKLNSFDDGIQAPDSSDDDSNGDNSQNSPGDAIDLNDILSGDEMREVLKTYSNRSPEMRKYFAEIEKREKNRRIKSAIEKFFNSHKDDSKKTIKKLNRRYSFLPYGKMKNTKQKILLALDVSGSMLCPDDLEKLKMSVNSATSNGFKVDLIFGDTEKLGQFLDIKSNFDFTKIQGGGGTDLAFIFEEKLKDYDCTVIVTDGEFNQRVIPKNLKNSILFLNTTDRPIDGFKNLHI